MAKSSKEKDMELYKTWKRTRSTADLSPLFKQLDPIIQKEVNRWSGVLARPVVEIEARRLAMQAFNNYNEHAGAALATHLTNYLQKLSRLIYTHQNVARIPEYQTLKLNTYRRAYTDLETEHGRPATQQEVAARLGWSQSAVKGMNKLVKSEQLEFHDKMPSFTVESEDGTIDLVYHDLNTTQKIIFEHQTGYGNKKRMSNQQLMRKLKLTQGQLSYEKRRMVERIQSFMR
jgi:DNA-directed RNA polymerase specialized sigma subunit